MTGTTEEEASHVIDRVTAFDIDRRTLINHYFKGNIRASQ